MAQNFTKRDIAWIKPVQHKIPVSEMSEIDLRAELSRWKVNERIAHTKFENNLDSGCYIAFQGCWTKCKRLIKEIEDEMKRRGLNG